jgi:hypothetical protein
MKRNEVFVVAKLPDGRRVSADVLDLDNDSFRAFLIDVLTGGRPIWYHQRPGHDVPMQLKPEDVARYAAELDAEDEK